MIRSSFPFRDSPFNLTMVMLPYKSKKCEKFNSDLLSRLSSLPFGS